MKRLSFVLVLMLGLGLMATCFAMGKLDTQEAKTPQEIIEETENVVAEAYSVPEEVVEVEASMNESAESAQEVVEEAEVTVTTEIAAEVKATVKTEATEEVGIIEQLGISDQLESLTTMAEMTSVLLEKANELYGSEEFQKVVDVTQYVLQYLDADSQGAKDLLTKAKEALVATASETINGVAADISGKLGSFGSQKAAE